MLPLRSVFILLCVLCTRVLSGQNPVSFQLSVENGLASNTIYSVHQSKDGYIWAGSDAGLLRYDGLHWTQFSCPGQKSNGVTGVCETESGMIYCYNFSGQVMQCDGAKMKLLPRKEAVITKLAVWKNLVYIGGQAGVEMYNEDQSTVEPIHALNNSFGAGSIPGATNVQVDDKGRVWCTTKDKVYCYDQGKISAYTAALRAGDETQLHVYQLLVLPDAVWMFAATGGAIYRLAGNVFERYSDPVLDTLFADRKLTNIEYSHGYFWIGTYSGMIRWSENVPQPQHWFPYLAVSDVIQDTEGNFWFATLYNGLYRCPDLAFMRWDPAGKEQGRTMVTASVKLDGVSCFTTETGRLFYGTVQSGMKEAARGEVADVQFLRADAERNEILFGSNGFVYAMRDGAIRKTVMSYPSLRDAVPVKEGYYAAGSMGVGYFSSSNSAEFIPTPVTARCRELYHDAEHQLLWVSGYSGLYALDIAQETGGQLKYHVLDSVNVTAIAPAENGTLYALGSAGMLYRIEDGKAFLLDSIEQGTQVRDIEWSRGTLYCATNTGLLCYDLDSREVFRADDVFGLSTNDIQHVFISDGEIQLSTAKGMIVLPLDFRRERGRPHFRFRGVGRSNAVADASGAKAITVDYNVPVSIYVDLTGYSSAGDYRFEYRVSEEASWNSVSVIDGELKLPALPSGMNNVQVRVIDHFGVVPDGVITVPVEVTPVFWETWVFYLLCLVLISLITVAVFSYNVKRIRRKQEAELRRIRLESNLRLSRQTALAAQMNPHFLFNVLNSIKGYIYENDRAHASQYLDSFSSLVRRVLEMSSVSMVRLEDEIEVLRSYIDLEAMLLEGKFTSTIDLAENVDPNWIRIPSLLVQPFVENAFKHGLRHSTSDKELRIRFALVDDEQVLEVTIADNGIGRKAAQEINTTRSGSHRSFSSGATADRIQLMNNEEAGKVGVFYEDSHKGTTVRLRIRLDRKNHE